MCMHVDDKKNVKFLYQTKNDMLNTENDIDLI